MPDEDARSLRSVSSAIPPTGFLRQLAATLPVTALRPNLLLLLAVAAATVILVSAAAASLVVFVAALVGVAALGAGVLLGNVLIDEAGRRLALAAAAQSHDRLAWTLETLGSQDPVARVAAIYLLESLVDERIADRHLAVQVLSAFLQCHASKADASDATERPSLRADARAAVEVASRLAAGGDSSDQSALDLRDLDLSGLEMQAVDLSHRNLTGTLLRWARLTSASLDWSVLLRCDLGYADLSASSLHGAYLESALLIGTVLDGANLRQANLHNATLRDARITNADLSGANLIEAKLQGADLAGANLRQAVLDQADLSGANLTGADLTGASLFEADLRLSSVSPGDVRGADLRGAKLPDDFPPDLHEEARIPTGGEQHDDDS